MTEEKNYTTEEQNEIQQESSNKTGKKKIIIKKNKFIIVLVLVFIFGASAGAHFSNYMITDGGEYTKISTSDYEILAETYERFGKLDYLYTHLKDAYYEELSDEDMMDGIYKGLFSSTGDPYTNYFTATEYESIMSQSMGEFFGIGITFTATEEGELIIISTIDDSPAAKAGLRTGDIIVAVDDVKYGADQLNEAASAMRGELNTKVKVTYKRDGEEKAVTITRKKITTESVYSEMLDDNIAYIRISTFDISTGDDFEKELRQREMQGVSGVIIDLRNNGGGVVDSGTHIADLLLPEGTIVYLEDKNGERTYYNSDSSCTSIPYVLLVNEGTASTSEILAVAVKENEGGAIVGTKTFGKGIVQYSTPLNDGTGMNITVQQYFSPDGNAIHGEGIEPDYIVELPIDATEDVQLNKAIEILKAE